MSSLLAFNTVFRLEIKSGMLVFSKQLCELLPQSQVQYVLCTQLYRQFGCMGEGGVLSCVGDHILQEFSTLNLTRFRT